MKSQNLSYRLKMIFGLFFVFPVSGFVYIGILYGLLSEKYTLYYLFGMLAFSYFGFGMLSRLFDDIGRISQTISEGDTDSLSAIGTVAETSELQSIVHSFSTIENQFKASTRELAQRAAEIAILKELSELCYMTFDPSEILSITLERALLLTHSDLGSVMILDDDRAKSFTVKATIGHGDNLQVDDKVDFETSIAKYAVINKSPLVVEDIETDTRFGRASLEAYGTKSFICMPIKTSQTIIGVLTISSRNLERIYELKDVESLSPLLSNAAFTYENIRLVRENERVSAYPKALEKLFKVLNSSIRDRELLNAILNEIREVIPFNCALVLLIDGQDQNLVSVSELFALEHVNINKDATYETAGSLIERVVRQDTTLTVPDTTTLAHPVDIELFGGQDDGACVLAPLKLGDTITGVLSLRLGRKEDLTELSELVPWLADVLSFTIERNRIASSMVRRTQELDAIRQIGNALASSTFDTQQVLNYTMDMIRVVIDAEVGFLMLEKDGELAFAAAFNASVDELRDLRIKVGQGIAGYVADRGGHIIENDAANSPHYRPEIDGVYGVEKRTTLCVSIISQGRVCGVIEVINKTEGPFEPNDLDLLQSIASSVSVAIENARLYEETVQMAEHERGMRGMFQKFVPKEILDRIMDERDTEPTVLEEMKTVTLLNVDIRGFTPLTRKLGPQKTVSLLNSFFAVMGGIVFEHNGIVDKYLGDGLLALFGAPMSRRQDADNAIAAAMEMIAALPTIEDEFAREIGSSITIGISIHTGEVVVGNFGFDMKMDYTVIGDSVNIVFRMQDLTKPYPNGILISETTAQAAVAKLALQELELNGGSFRDIPRALKIYRLDGLPAAKAV